jgi:DNA-binding CsgD family transcriptional regulator
MTDPFQDLFARLGLQSSRRRHSFALEAELHSALQEQALREQRQPDELAAELLSSGLARRQGHDVLRERWQSLSPREQDVCAYACLGCTNRQMAAHMGISEETVKTHMQNALMKFRLHGKSQLRIVLEQWDFSDWEERTGTGVRQERPGTGAREENPDTDAWEEHPGTGTWDH